MNAFINNLYIKNNRIFSKSKIEKEYPVIEFSGNIYTGDKIFDENQILDIGKNKYIGPSGSYDDYIQHSCNPNTKVKVIKTRAFLYSIKTIRPNEEITFDYSTVILDKNLKLVCTCKQFSCKKILQSILNDEAKYKDYLTKGLIPNFMEIK